MSSPKHNHVGNPDQPSTEYPKLSEKQDFPQSNITTLRKREPTNRFIASKFSSMVNDHRSQMPIVPSRVATGANSVPTTTNKSGKPYALNTFVGGSPDTQGHPLDSPVPQRMTE